MTYRSCSHPGRGAATEFSRGCQPTGRCCCVSESRVAAAESTAVSSGTDAPPIAMTACAIAVLAVACSNVFADTPAPSDEQREQRQVKLLEQMRERARATSVRYQESDRGPQLLNSPVFRFDDQPRSIVDATMWVWTDGGRPVAFEKIEATAVGRPGWTNCFASVGEKLLAVKWSDVRLDTGEEMRLLPAPIFEYSEPGRKDSHGAVFGLATSGTNPAMFILLEPRIADGESVWHYGVVRMTSCGVTLKYRGNAVWQADAIHAPPAGFPTWTFFFTPRQEPSDDAADIDSKPSTARSSMD